jgi:phage terminase large subunit-like protein
MDGLRPVSGMGEAVAAEDAPADAVAVDAERVTGEVAERLQALAPEGWRTAREAEALVSAAARLAADESKWVRRAERADVSWEAMRLQVARGRQITGVAHAFDVNPKSLIVKRKRDEVIAQIAARLGVDPPPNRKWTLAAPELEALSRLVAEATMIRRATLGITMTDANRAQDALAFEWEPIVAPEKIAVEAPIDPLDDPDAPETERRDAVRQALSALLEEAKAAGDARRAQLVRRVLAGCTTERAAGWALDHWSLHAHAAQLAPEVPWRTWMLMGGRGAGKTRAGAEWVRELVESGIAKRVALVGPTLHDVREVMIAGPSGLCAIGPEEMRPTYEVTRRRLVWPPVGLCKGAVAFAFSAEDPDSLRGPQFDAAWCDEIGAWAKDLDTWKTLAFGMRLGPAPRIVATTTPRPRALVKLLAGKAEAARGGVVLTQAGTRANAQNLSPEFVEALEEDYGGTELGRQELDGELIEDREGALWTRAMIERARCPVEAAEGLERVVVAVDPPVSVGARSDACGIIVAGVKDGIVYVLADATVRGLRPAEWAEKVAWAAEAHGARLVVAEGNQGGVLVRDVLVAAGKGRVRVRMENATEGKKERAQPVSTLYERGRVRHVRVLKELEDEMCSFGVDGAEKRSRSPDRVDALVWAVSELTRRVVIPSGSVL